MVVGSGLKGWHGKPVSLLEFCGLHSEHQTAPMPATQKPFTMQPKTKLVFIQLSTKPMFVWPSMNYVFVTSPYEWLEDGSSISTHEWFLYTPKTLLVSPELDPMRQVRKIEGGVFYSKLHTPATLLVDTVYKDPLLFHWWVSILGHLFQPVLFTYFDSYFPSYTMSLSLLQISDRMILTNFNLQTPINFFTLIGNSNLYHLQTFICWSHLNMSAVGFKFSFMISI